MVIGLSGVAGAGKDLFYELLSQQINVKRYSLADNLKRDVADFTLNKYKIHALNCSREEKETIRPFLVFHGSVMRQQTNGRYWTEMLQKQIEEENPDSRYQISHICITDIRYDDYKNDEVSWLKNEMKGKLIHISQYRIEEYQSKKEWPKKRLGRVFTKPANEEEKRNDPKLKETADFCIEWPRVGGEEKFQKDFILSSFALEAIKNLKLK